MWSVQVSRWEGVSFQRAEPGACYSPARGADQWAGRPPRHGRPEPRSRTVSVRQSVQTHCRGDSRGLSDALQSIPHLARAILHGCHSGGAEAILEREDPEEGERKFNILLELLRETGAFVFQIHLHGKNLESLHRYIPKEALPIQYGGTQQAFDNSAWKREILNDAEYFHRLEQFHVANDLKSCSSSPDEVLNSERQLIDTETDSEGESDRSSNQFFNCDSHGPRTWKSYWKVL